MGMYTYSIRSPSLQHFCPSILVKVIILIGQYIVIGIQVANAKGSELEHVYSIVWAAILFRGHFIVHMC